MEISKLKAGWKLLTGGVAGLIEYILDEFNRLIAKLPTTEVAKYAQLAKDVANFVQNLANAIISNEAKKKAALITAQAFADLATALLDSKLTSDELDNIIDVVKEAIEAWKKA